MRRKDREIDKAAALEIVDKCTYSVLSMSTAKGEPYAVPLSTVRIGNNVYFHCATSGKKSEILSENPNVCIVCVGDTRPVNTKFTVEYESAIIFGTAEKVTYPEEKIGVLRHLCERHSPGNMAKFDEAISQSLHHTDIWKITISEITGKRRKVK